ncbi:PAS domain-containing protein [Tenacibaculum discolor]|uniref:PAS domain-containing protein n=1 Tax=Tenacibaculum discolor TaxID=361581 RepID=UPI000EB23CD5|nr:PAS domain S-box protein [Tenacibaculum discolor]RLJ96887.1 PAS domain S-box-containing protein [Tenacibaculum discolor]
MRTSMGRKNLYGYIINSIMVIVLGIIYWKQMDYTTNRFLNWVSLVLIVLILGMLTIVFLVLKTQIKAKEKSQEELLRNQRLLQSIINNTTNVISVKKINGEYILVNEKYQLIFGKSEESLIGKTNHDILPKEIADRYLEADLEAIKAGKEIQIEEVVEQSDGPHIYLSVKFPLFDTSNRVYAIGSISTDITERKAIMESQKEADTFFNISTDSLVIASNEKFLKVNTSLSNLLGYTKEELLRESFATYIFPEDIEKTNEAIKKLEMGANLVSFNNRWICKDKSIKWLSWNATSDKNTGTLYAVARDITKDLLLQEESEKRMNELYENQQKLNMIIENISDGVLVANTDKQVILANEVANELFGIEDDSKISVDFSDHFKVINSYDGKVFPIQNLPAELALEGKITNDIDVLLMNKETNEIRRVLLSGRPIIDNENYIAAVVVTIKDISRYKRLEAELKRKDQESRRRIGFKKDDSKKKE